jgi:hypothetical protein
MAVDLPMISPINALRADAPPRGGLRIKRSAQAPVLLPEDCWTIVIVHKKSEPQLKRTRQALSTLALAAALALAHAAAHAEGCTKGAVVGGAAGHVAGHHGMAGAAAGCAIGHHEAKKKDKAASAAAAASEPAKQ